MKPAAACSLRGGDGVADHTREAPRLSGSARQAAEEWRCLMATTASVPAEEWTETRAGSWARILATDAGPRCGGHLVRAPFVDLEDDGARHDHAVRRCAHCVEVHDAIILRTRIPRL